MIVAGTVSHPQSRIRIGWHRPPWDVWRGIQLVLLDPFRYLNDYVFFSVIDPKLVTQANGV